MAHTTTRRERFDIIAKIIIGFVQVLKDAPRLLREEPHYPDVWHYLQLGSIDLSLFIPCIPVNYWSRFIANVFVAPVCLLAVVAMAWRIDQEKSKKVDRSALSAKDLAEYEDQRQTSLRSDYYWAFFLACESRACNSACKRRASGIV